jgi:hypothetical protein
MRQLLLRDAADERNAVAAHGMDGFLGVIRSAMATDDTEETVSHAPGAQDVAGLDATLEKKAKLQCERQLEELDKYELKRFHLEQKLKQAPAARCGEAGRVASGTESSGLEEAEPSKTGGGSPREYQEGGGGNISGHGQGDAGPGMRPGGAAAGSKKRSGADKIAAARERAKERKLKR